jgi:hypothetical protein
MGNTGSDQKSAAPACERCGSIVELRVTAGPAGPIVASICQPCSLVVVPYRGIGAATALASWLARNARRSASS